MLRCLLPLALLPWPPSPAPPVPSPTDADPAELSGGCAERAHCDVLAGSARQSTGFLRSLLAGIDGDGRVQMAMNGGIYDKAYAPLGLYIEDGKRLTPVNRSAGGGTSLSARRRILVENGRAKIVPLPAYKPSPAIRYAVQSGPMLIENGAINWRLKPSASSRKLRNGLVSISRAGWCYAQRSRDQLYDFACYAQSKLGVRQMLYLDGTLSKMYRKGGSVPWQYHPFVTMITVEKIAGAFGTAIPAE